MKDNIPFSLSLDEINTVLGVLAERPYREVAGLIGKIGEQAERALTPVAKPEPTLLVETNPEG